MKCLFLYSCNARVTEEKHNTVCSTEKHKICETYKGLQTKRPCEWAVKIQGGRYEDLPADLQKILAPPSRKYTGER